MCVAQTSVCGLSVGIMTCEKEHRLRERLIKWISSHLNWSRYHNAVACGLLLPGYLRLRKSQTLPRCGTDLLERTKTLETKPNDALAILKLYEIRSEALMRQARAWFLSEFNPQSGLEILGLMQSGEKQSAFYRMVSSHWEVAAALVNNGGIDEKMFLEANSEHLVVFAKLQ